MIACTSSEINRFELAGSSKNDELAYLGVMFLTYTTIESFLFLLCSTIMFANNTATTFICLIQKIKIISIFMAMILGHRR